MKEFFSDELQNQFEEQAIGLGQVIRLYVHDTNPPKIKRFIIVGENTVTRQLACVYINSELNVNYTKDSRWSQAQLYLQSSDGRTYLDRESWVNCAQIHEKNSKEILIAIRDTRNQTLLGTVSEEDLNEIRLKIKVCPLIKDLVRKKYGLNE